jgi:hypothetical protein
MIRLIQSIHDLLELLITILLFSFISAKEGFSSNRFASESWENCKLLFRKIVESSIAGEEVLVSLIRSL